MNYVDTSVLVASLTTEAHTRRAERWLTQAGSGELAVSEWVIAEFSAALSIKVRVGSIDTKARSAVLGALGTMEGQSLILLPVVSAHFRTAARFADQYRLGLGAADALHLAIAAERGASFCTLDKRLAIAGKALGVATKLV